MSKKIKIQTFKILFQLFDFLADKTGGWSLFVRPKILIGSLIMGLGLTVGGGKIGAKEKLKNSIGNTQNTKLKTATVEEHTSSPVKLDSKPQQSNPLDDIQKNPSEVVEEKAFCYITEVMPVFPGGEGELMKYIANNLKYPEDAIKKKIQGKVICRFIVTELGEISEVTVLRSLDASVDDEAIKVLKQMPKWTPGQQNGKNSKVYYVLPITFKLPK